MCLMGNTGRETKAENTQYPLGCWQIHIQIRWRRYFRERTETVHTIEMVNYKTRTIRNPLKILLYIQATSNRNLFSDRLPTKTPIIERKRLYEPMSHSFSPLFYNFFFSCPMSSQLEREEKNTFIVVFIFTRKSIVESRLDFICRKLIWKVQWWCCGRFIFLGYFISRKFFFSIQFDGFRFFHDK